MAGSIAEAIAEAITEIKTHSWVIDAWENTSITQEVGNYYLRGLQIFHRVSGGDVTDSTKLLYIHKTTFEYYFHHQGGATAPISTPFKDLLESKMTALKTLFSVDWAEITSYDEITESGIVTCIKAITGNQANTYTVKAWKNGSDIEAKIIEIIIV